MASIKYYYSLIICSILSTASLLLSNKSPDREKVTVKSTGVPILIVEQNAKQALGVSDRGYVLVDGANRHEGTGQGLANDPEIARMFLGGGH